MPGSRKTTSSRREIEGLIGYIEPQLTAAWDVVRNWPLGKDMQVMSSLIVLKVIAITSGQLKEMGVYDKVKSAPVDGPDDGGFF